MSVPSHVPGDIAAVWTELAAAGWDTQSTGFESLCGQTARLRDAQRRISAEGLVVADEKGRPIPHPALAIERAAQAEIRAWQGKIRKARA